ncbi:MAG: hypothetical protein IJX47_02275 [Clostridia bacterium]|nr:hypothetical protein [Clostridia bacterium]MBQ8382012.1 hypothetical protein [Clostridia bacterium]
MATHEILIKLDPSVRGVSTEGVSPTPSSGVATQKNASVAPQNGNMAGMAKAAAAKVATQTIQSVAQVYQAQRTTEINVLTGSQQYAQRQAAINSVSSAGINILSGTIQSGSILTAMGMGAGPAGALAFGMSLLSTLISGFTEYQQKKNEIQTNYTAEQQELDYLRSRAGPFYNGSR